MKISHFNTFPYGGAAVAARRIHDGLRDEGLDSRFFYWKDERNSNLEADYEQVAFEKRESKGILKLLKRYIEKSKQRQIKRRYDKHIRPRDRRMEVFSGATLLKPTPLDWQQVNCDVVQLHWTAFMADYASLFDSIDDQTPIVWTLHDMNPFTGGCHYSNNCEQFTTGCGNCPQLVSPGPKDESRYSFRTKQAALKSKNVTVVAPSSWMLNQARLSPVFPMQTRFELIQYGFDLKEWKPVKKHIARRQLGINDDDCVVIGFGAEDINHHRKGLHLLLDSLRKLSPGKKVKCLVFGCGDLSIGDVELPDFHSVGFIDSTPRKALIYSAMDLFALPSLEDNSPQTGLEAMACATPVVAFAAGGIPEYVIPYRTGISVTVGNTDQFADAINWMVANRFAREKMSEHAREFMLQHHAVDLQTERYVSLYRDLLGIQQELDTVQAPRYFSRAKVA